MRIRGRSTPGAAPHWAQVTEATCVAGMKLLYAIYRVLGRAPFLFVLYPVVFYYWATRDLARRSSAEYLRRMQLAHGALWNQGNVPDWWHGVRHFKAFADAILHKLLAAGGHLDFEQVSFVGRTPIQDLIERGEGALFITAHVGSLEMVMEAAGRHIGIKLNVLVHTAHAERFEGLLARVGRHGAVNLMQVTELTAATAALLADKVAHGEFVAIAGDRIPVHGGRTVEALFMGHAARFPVGPYVLGMLLECPMYLMLCLREGRGHRVVFECLAERVRIARGADGERTVALAGYATQFAGRVEALLAEAPYEWFNFYPFWDQPSVHSPLRPEASPP